MIGSRPESRPGRQFYFRERADMPACAFEITRVLCRFLGGS